MAVKSIADDVADYLTTAAGGSHGTVGTDIFVGKLVDSPNDQIAVFPTGGGAPSAYIADIHEPTFQVLIRNDDFDAGNTILRSVRTALHKKINLTLTNFVALNILAASEGGAIGQDERGLYEFTINFSAKVRPT